MAADKMNGSKHIFENTIRFSDVDAFGHVNNACYLTYYEEARVSYFDRIVGWEYNWSEKGIILARAEVDFIQPVHFKDKVFVRIHCSRMGNKSFDLSCEMYKNEAGKEIMLSACKTILVMYDYGENRSIPLTDEWRTALEKDLQP